MSENEVPCPSCGAALEIDDSAPAGEVVRCPECGAGLILSGEKSRPLKLKEAPKSSKSGKKPRPRLSWGMGGASFVLLAPAKS
jgi:lysine biosynthesis protein LysW